MEGNLFTIMNGQLLIFTYFFSLGKPLPAEVVQRVVEFYHDDDVSSLKPGMKEFLSRRNDKGVRVHHQKQLLLGNLKELYQRFKEIHPDATVGFSRFAELRPDYCVLSGSSGTHPVCVCSNHQNFKFKMSDNSTHMSLLCLTIRFEKSILIRSALHIRFTYLAVIFSWWEISSKKNEYF